MANQTRLRQNAISGTFTNPVGSSDTAMVSSQLTALSAVDATQHAVLIFDPEGAGNGPEIVYVTAHTAASTGATIVRGREGSSGVTHATTTTIVWVHGPVASDFVPFTCTSATRPSGSGLPYQGMEIFETDTYETLEWNGTNWRRPWKDPWGIIDYVEVTANQPSLGVGPTLLTNLSLSATFVANRRVRIRGFGNFTATGGGGQGVLYIRETTSTPTTIQTGLGDFTGINAINTMIAERVISPTAGAHTYSLYAGKNAFDMDLTASSTSPAFLLIEDIGPNGSPT